VRIARCSGTLCAYNSLFKHVVCVLLAIKARCVRIARFLGTLCAYCFLFRHVV